ncbi:MAG: hypothetical protein AAGI38_16760 [Bacteroidota bacterium]
MKYIFDRINIEVSKDTTRFLCSTYTLNYLAFMHVFRTILLFISFGLIILNTWGQKNPQKDVILGMAITGTGFYGDLNYSSAGIAESDFFTFYPGFNLNLRADAAKRLLPKLNLGYAQFVSQNPDLPPAPVAIGGSDTLIQPNTFSETVIVYGDVGFHINLIRRYAMFKPFLGISIGGMTFSPRGEDGNPLIRRRSTRAPSERDYPAISYQLPLTAGLDVNLGSRLGLNLAYTYRLVGTDYLDNIALLGKQEGNDRLHAIQFGVNFRVFDAGKYVPPRIARPLPTPEFEVPVLSDMDEDSLITNDPAFLAWPDVSAVTAECDSLYKIYSLVIAEKEAQMETLEAQRAFLQQQVAQQELEIAQLSNQLNQSAAENIPAPQATEQPSDYVPAFAINITASTPTVQQHVITYFERMGYKYQLEAGRMQYRKFRIPGSDKTRYEVNFFMGKTKTGTRQLMATFLTPGGTYLTRKNNPQASQKAESFIQNLCKSL